MTMGTTKTPGLTLATEFRALADATIEKNATDVRPDERDWARDTFAEFIGKARQRALAGGTVAYADIPESDVLRPSRLDELAGYGECLLRGGAAFLRTTLERSGFKVSIGFRYDGHPRGAFCLEVRW